MEARQRVCVSACGRWDPCKIPEQGNSIVLDVHSAWSLVLSILCRPFSEGGSRFGNEPREVGWLVGAGDRPGFLAQNHHSCQGIYSLRDSLPAAVNEGNGSFAFT